MRRPSNILKETPKQLDPNLQFAIDQSFRNDPELRKDIYQSIDVPHTEEYIVDAQHEKVKFTADPKKVLNDYIKNNNLGNVIDIIGGGNGIAALLDDDKVIKITGDEAEHIQAQSLKGKTNEYVVNVFDTAPFETPYYTKDSNPAYVIVLELLTHPTTAEEKRFRRCCCKEDNPIYVDFYSDPSGKVLIHPPVDGSKECQQVYEDIVNISKEIETTGRRWLDIGISNVGMKNGHYALLDLGTNDPLLDDLREENIRDKHQLWRPNPQLEVGDKVVVVDNNSSNKYRQINDDGELMDALTDDGFDVDEGNFAEIAIDMGYRWDEGRGWYHRDDEYDWVDIPELFTPYMVVNVSIDEHRNQYYTLITPKEYEEIGKEYKIEDWNDITLDTLYDLNVDPKSLYPGSSSWVYSKDTIPKRYLKEQYEFQNGGGEITPKIISLIRTAHRLHPPSYFEQFYGTLKKYMDVGGIFSSSEGKQIAATLWLIIKEGGGFSDWNITNLLSEPLPTMYYYTVEYYEEDYGSEEILEECLKGGGGEYYGELSEEDCECIVWDEFYDEEKDEYRECTDEEKDEGKCDCDQMEDKYVDQYYYEQMSAEYLSTVELEHPFSHIDELTNTAGSMHEETVELMSTYYDTTEYQVEGEFDFDEGGDVQDWADHDADVEYHLELLNDALYPDADILGDSTSVEVITEEQQLDLFHGAWPFDSVMEDEDKEWIMKDYPENAVKYLYKKWDQDGVSWEDLKLLGLQAVQGDAVTMLLKRYILTTQAPIPVTSLWDCDDLTRLFGDDNNKELIEKYLCGNDPWDWDGWYYNNEFQEGVLDYVDDGSWKMIMKILGVKDKELAGRLLLGEAENEEEEGIIEDKETEISEIRSKMTHAESIESEDATKRAIFEDIDDKIVDWFDGSGKLVRNNENGSYSWVIESDLKNWISEDDWDNTDYFEFHGDYADRPLEDVMRDMARLTPDQLFGEIMVEEFGPGDDYNDGKQGDHLEIDSKYFDGYWYPDISEEYFNEILYEDLYELVPEGNDPHITGELTPPEPLNEHARISTEIIEKLQGKEVRITLDENNSFLISRLRGTPFGERPFGEELIFTIDNIRQKRVEESWRGGVEESERGSDYILTYDLLFKGAEPEGGRIDEFINEYNLDGDSDRDALMKTFMQDRQPIQDQMYENVFKLFGIDDPHLERAYIPRPPDTPPREFFRDPSGLRESIDPQKVNPPLESGDEIIVIDVKGKTRRRTYGGVGRRETEQVPELFVPYRVTTTPKRDQYWYGINRPMKDVSYPDRPGVLSNSAVMRYLMPEIDTWIMVEKNKGMWDDDIDLLRESVTNFKELYNASPRPLQQILIDQWKVKQNPEWHPEGNVLKHIITVTNRAFATQPENINLILSAYFHDLGKLATAGVNSKTGHPTAHGHEKVSTQLVNEYSEFIESLGGDPEEIVYMVSNHMKMKPRVWDVMRQSKKDNITDHPSFDNLDALSKIDRGGLQLDEEKMEFGKDKGMYDDDKYYDFTPFTNLEVKLLNRLAQELTFTELEEIGSHDEGHISGHLEQTYRDVMKLFSINPTLMEDWVIATKYARWAVDNWNEAVVEEEEERKKGTFRRGKNEAGRLDFATVKTPVKIYPSSFEVAAEEEGWEKIFKRGEAEVVGFGGDDVTQRAQNDWHEWGGEMETYDYGDWESDGWNVDSVTHRETIKEQSENLPLKKFLHQNYTKKVFTIYKKLALAAKLLLTSYEDPYTEGGARNFKYGGFGGGEGGRGEIDLLADKIDTAQRELYFLWGIINEDLYKLGLIDTLNIGPPDERDFISYNRLRGLTLNPVVKDWARQIIDRIDNMELVALTGKWEGNDKGIGKEVEIWGGNTPYVLREHKEKLNPPLNIGDVIRVVDVDKDTKYKQSAGSGMYRNVTRSQLHGADTFPTPMETYYVTSPQPVDAEQIDFGNPEDHEPNFYWNLLAIRRGSNPDAPDEFQLTADDFNRENGRIITTNDKWIMVKKHISNIPQEIDARQKEIDTSGKNITSRRLNEQDDESGFEDDELYVEYGPFTPLEVKILNTIVREFTLDELKAIATRLLKGNIQPQVTSRYEDVMKLFGEPKSGYSGAQNWTIISKYARWALENRHEADDGDYGQIKNARKEYPAEYQVDASESGWEQVFKSGSAQVTAFGSEDAADKATEDFYAWGGEMHTDEMGEYESDDWEITDTFHIDTLKEHFGEGRVNSLVNFLNKNYKEDVLGTYRHYALLKRLEPAINNNNLGTASDSLGQAIADLMELWTTLNGDLYKLGLIPLPRPDHHGPEFLLSLNDHPVVREWVYNIINRVDEMDIVDIRDDGGNFIRYALREVTTPLRILKEQEIDTTKIPKEEISPPLKVGDKIFMWDLEMDPTPPGTTILTMPNTTVGTVVYVYEGNASEEPRGDVFRGGIKYDIDTYDGHFGLYQGVEDYDYYAEDGGGRDKWIILKNTPLTEAIIPQLPKEERPNIPNYIRRLLIIGRFESKGGSGKTPQTFLLYMTPTGGIVDIVKSGTLNDIPFQIGDTINIFDLRDFEEKSDYTLTMGGKLRGEITEHINRPLQAVQKDFLIKRKFFESFDKMDLTAFIKVHSEDITPKQVVEKRKLIFDFLSEVKNKDITNENFFTHFLVGGKDWINTYSTVLKKDSGTLSEEGDNMKNLIWETTIHTLKNKNKEVTLREAKINLLPTAARLVNLWKETL